MNMNNRSDILVAFALGAVAGILLAPDRGEVTRRRITEKSKDLFGNARDRVGGVADTLRDQGRAMKEAVTSAKDSYREEVGRPRPGLRSETNP
jgi:gas vesicle protein